MYSSGARSYQSENYYESEVLTTPALPERSNTKRLALGGGLATFILIGLIGVKSIGRAIEPSQQAMVSVPSMSSLDEQMAAVFEEQLPVFEEQMAVRRSEEHLGLTVISLLGPPGVGKSALSRHITPDFDFLHVSTGDLIRDEIKAGTAIGNRTATIVKSGGLVDDETVTALIEKKLKHLNSSTRGIILDGFPRRLTQAKLLDSGEFKIPHLAAVVSVTMPDHILEIRRSGRRICPVCGATYNLHEVDQDGYYLKARLPCNGKCCEENATLVPRPDDDPKIAADRMRVYHEENPAMLDYYRDQKILIEVEKKRQMKVVYKDIRSELAELVHRARKRQQRELKKSG